MDGVELSTQLLPSSTKEEREE
jgi:hypothetical protein